ncbi:MAG: DUF721 domain-containing protein [Rickettsiales bacterium]|nr:DUF721 domain-containing protein [Rickettsiales bacterium]
MSDTPRRFSLFPKTLGDCIEPVTRPALKSQGLAGSKILTEWPAIVGPELSRHCLPESLSFPRGKKTGGTLTISAENGFATQLTHMQPIILERLASYFGYQAVARMVISHSWVAMKHAEKAKPKQRMTAQEAAVTDEVTDPDLREALAGLGRALSGQE